MVKIVHAGLKSKNKSLSVLLKLLVLKKRSGFGFIVAYLQDYYIDKHLVFYWSFNHGDY